MPDFSSDYNNGCHPDVLERLTATNNEIQPGYGSDAYCAGASAKILKACNLEDGTVDFIAGGTQTNLIVISSLLSSVEGVVAAETAHINVHESGAIEACGHKVISLPQSEGKIKAEDLSACLESFYSDGSHEHMVYPGMVYLSFPTEYGTLYAKKELEALHSVCKKYNIPLFIDGARLGYGLVSPACDLTLEDIARLTDVFTIGGTKAGALCGEAVVFTHGNRPVRFTGIKKQHGGLLAKGRVLGLQFDALFTDNLYFRIARSAVSRALELKKVLLKAGFRLFVDSFTNQQFFIVPAPVSEFLAEKTGCSRWERLDAHNDVVRFVTSWSTSVDDIFELEKLLRTESVVSGSVLK